MQDEIFKKFAKIHFISFSIFLDSVLCDLFPGNQLPRFFRVSKQDESRCQFHQYFMHNACRSQKRRKIVKPSVFFALLGSVCVKAARKMLVKLNPVFRPRLLRLWASITWRSSRTTRFRSSGTSTSASTTVIMTGASSSVESET